MKSEDLHTSFNDILTSIQKPLIFASKNSFSMLDQIKGLEELIPKLSDTAKSLSEKKHKDFFQKTSAMFSTYSSLSTELKKELILETLQSVNSLKNKHFENEKKLPPAPCPPENMFEILNTPVGKIRGIGSKTEALLQKKKIFTIEDLLYLIPRTYIDRRRIFKISQLRAGSYATVTGNVLSFSKSHKTFEMLVNDGTQTLTAKWFQSSPKFINILKKKFPEGCSVMISGTVTQFRFRIEMCHPEIQLMTTDDDLRDRLLILPVYPLTEGIHQKTLQRIMKTIVDDYIPQLSDYLHEGLKKTYGLESLGRSFSKVHFPDKSDKLIPLIEFTSPYHRRIVFDEFFFLQLGLALRKKGKSIEKGISFSIPENKTSSFLNTLPFSLTKAQKRVLSDIVSDMKKPSPMNRLLQGDVGSGKTIVSCIASLITFWNGFQSTIMAPTEILAEQHFKTVSKLVSYDGFTAVLLTSSLTKTKRQQALEQIRCGQADLIIGTHAVIQESVEFNKLGLAVIDEQHRFGVMQRGLIKKKGINPDILVMSATPIPRTLGLTVYGDLDISIIDEMPPGRKPVITKVVYENRRKDVYRVIREKLSRKNQAFIVYPIVEESEKLDLLDATRMAAHLQQDIFPEFKVGIVHGRMSQTDKDSVMKEFHCGNIDILVATTVIEVGIDVPNASVMIVEHAERFGLSQLHQLRGRVGRGQSESICILMASNKVSDDASKRLSVMAKTCNGFKIAEEDFNIRGPGEFLGTKQSGMPDFRVAHIGRDINILVESRKAAFELTEKDPSLTLPEHRLIREMLKKRWKDRFELAGI